jgi:hypothetical protein
MSRNRRFKVALNLSSKCCGFNGSAQHWLEFYSRESRNLRSFAGAVYILVTKNVTVQLLFNIAAMLLLCFDHYVLTPRPTLSLSVIREVDRPKFRLSPLMFVCFALIMASCVSIPYIRVSRPLMITGLFMSVLDRYAKTGSISATK